MSLLTGEPRSASVVAATEVEVVVVEKGAFSTLLQDDGHLARALSEALEERSRSQARVEAPVAGAVGPEAITDGLLDRIQRFFGLEG
jgi:CRP-like cAMP-binding protein